MKRTLIGFSLCALLLGSTAIHIPAPSVNVSAQEQATAVTAENAQLFLPDSFEQYLSLSAPTDAALYDEYIAVADGTELYVYDRAENSYSHYTHGQNISKIQFSENGQLYFSDEQAYLYSFDIATMTADKTGANSSTFYIEGNVIYTAIVTNQLTTLSAYDMSDFQTPIHDNLGQIESFNGTPRMTYLDGMLLCAVNQIVYTYTDEGAGDSFLLSRNSGEVSGVSAVCAYDGAIYYAASDGLYRTDTQSNSKRIYEGTGFTALTVYGSSLYCVKGASILQTDVSGDTATFTGYEICASSDSVNRLKSGVQTVRTNGLLVTSDSANRRISLYAIKAGTYSAIACDYAPALVATDGNTVVATDGGMNLYVYDKTGALLYTNQTQTTITGIACIYGNVYFITQNSGYGAASETGANIIFRNGSSALSALTCDIYGNLYVAHADGSVVRYGETHFLDNTQTGTPLSYTLPSGYSSLRADFEGNLYCMKDNSIYQNGVPFATVDASNTVYREELPDLRSYALGYEDNTVYLLYDDFMLQTQALAFPVLNRLSYGDVQQTLYTPQTDLTLVTVQKGAIGIRTDLNLLKTAEEGFFPYDGYFRSQTACRGILLSQTEEYYLVALFGSDHKYTANLFKKTFCEKVPQSEYYRDQLQTMYLTSDVSPCYFPCLIPALRADRLTRATQVRMLGTVESSDTSDYTYAFIEYQMEDGKYAGGFIPLSYLTDVVPEVMWENCFLATLKATQEGVLFTAEDESEITVTEATQVEVIRTEDGLVARIVQDGKTYQASIAEEALEAPVSDALRMSLIVILCVLAAIIVGAYVILLPRKHKRK